MSPPVSRRNAICFPSGENTLFQLLPSLVRATSFPERISTAWMSLPPSCRSVYVIHLPSGEYEGLYDSPVAPLIPRGTAIEPFTAINRMRGSPSVYEVTAIVFPSGDHVGSDRFEPFDKEESSRRVWRS